MSHHSGDQFASTASPRCRGNTCRRKGIPVSAIRPKRGRSGKSNQFDKAFPLDPCSLNTDLAPLAERCRASSPGSRFISCPPRLGQFKNPSIPKLNSRISWAALLSAGGRSVAPSHPPCPRRTVLGASADPGGFGEARADSQTGRGSPLRFPDGRRRADPAAACGRFDKQGNFEAPRHFEADCHVPCLSHPLPNSA
jgi:hypothetical protein